MSAVAEIRAAQARTLFDEDGEEVPLVLGPPATADEIAALEERVGGSLPRELREVLAVTRSVEGPLELIDFLGVSGGMEVPGMPAALELAGDGFGNFWVADITAESSSDLLPVFFACHDPPVVLFQSPSIGDFLREVFRQPTPPHESLIDAVHDDRAFNVWGSDHGALTHEEALAAGSDLEAFARTLDHSDYLIYDLRDAAPGQGFAWGRAGPNTEVLRYGHQRIFAVVQRRPTGRLKRLLRRQTPPRPRASSLLL